MYNTNNGMYSNYEVEGSKEFKESKTTYTTNNSEGMMDMGYTKGMGGYSMPGCTMPVVYECPEERIIHREICHTVPHVCPINTRIINHHIYRHTYSPCYTCCDQNDILTRNILELIQ